MQPTSEKTVFLNRTIGIESLRLFIPGVLLLILGFSLYYNTALERDFVALKLAEQQQLESTKNSLLRELNTAINDLIILSKLKGFSELQGPTEQHGLAHIEQHFLALSRHRGLYDQIRYLDQSGMEVVRVNFNHGQPQLVPAERLQNKGKRYYFYDAFQLEQDQIFISPLDLNMEKGKIEQPLKPMIRLGMPLFDLEGNKHGIVLINYFGQQLIDTVDALSQLQQSDAMLINSDGHWLSHPNEKRRWGFMFKRDETMERHFPREWATIKRNREGQIETAEGIFTFSTIYPLGSEMFSSSGSAEAHARSEHPLSSNHYFWKIVTHIQSPQLAELEQQLLFYVLLHGTLLTILIMLAAWWRSYTHYRSCLSQQALEEQFERRAATLNTAIDAIITTDAKGHILEFNPSARQLFSFEAERVIGKDVAELIIPKEFRSQLRAALEKSNNKEQNSGKKGRFEAIAQSLDGRRFPVEITVVQMKQNRNTLYTAFLRDISDRKAYEESIRSAKHQLEMRVNQRTEELVRINRDLQEQIVERVRTEERLKIAQEELERSNQKLAEHASKDSLTGIANRRAFDARFEEEWQRCQRHHEPIALVLFDIDFFKRYNDHYGHLTGDECLRSIGGLLQQSNYAHRTGDLSARYGGEEFVIILSGSDLEGAMKVGEQVRKDVAALQIEHAERDDALEPIITISVGAAALRPSAGGSPQKLIAAADKALYSAKSKGRNQLVSYSET